MARDYPTMKVCDLVPYELSVTGPKLNTARRNLRNGFTKPVEVFQLDESWFVKDGTHRCTVAVELGIETVPVVQVDPPSDWPTVREQMARHLELKGFQKMPQTGLAERAERDQKIDLDALKELLDARKGQE